MEEISMQTTGNTVLITGGSSGIGLALAKQFVKHGNAVIITGRNGEKLAEVQAALPMIQTERVNMSDTTALRALATRHASVNILVNNAAIQDNYDFGDSEVSLDRIDVEIDTNFRGPLVLTKLMLPHLLRHPSAAIVNVSSGLGFVPKQTAPVYCGTKAAIHIFTKALRWQLETSHIKVFELIPPLVATPMTEGRGRGKIEPEAVANAFWAGFQRNQWDIPVGKTRLLLWLQRLMPHIADRIMRPGL
jgi:short-subunit dehydrogenase involved in D-alanine esterification of teichoic acids